jgi:hypothetical protein
MLTNDEIREMRRVVVEELHLCGYAEVQRLPLTDLIDLCVQYVDLMERSGSKSTLCNSEGITED